MQGSRFKLNPPQKMRTRSSGKDRRPPLTLIPYRRFRPPRHCHLTFQFLIKGKKETAAERLANPHVQDRDALMWQGDAQGFCTRDPDRAWNRNNAIRFHHFVPLIATGVANLLDVEVCYRMPFAQFLDCSHIVFQTSVDAKQCHRAAVWTARCHHVDIGNVFNLVQRPHAADYVVASRSSCSLGEEYRPPPPCTF